MESLKNLPARLEARRRPRLDPSKARGLPAPAGSNDCAHPDDRSRYGDMLAHSGSRSSCAAKAMSPSPDIRTPRLWLRAWRPEDRGLFRGLNADPAVMEHLPSVLTPEESDELANRIEAHFLDHGFGLWAVEVPGMAQFIGYVGLSVPSFQAHFTPCVEIGWRLARPYWGNGYATEGAREVLRFGFTELSLREIVSFTVPANVRSRRVMDRLGMHHSPADDFDHPKLPEGHQMRRHVLYRMTRADWKGQIVCTFQ